MKYRSTIPLLAAAVFVDTTIVPLPECNEDNCLRIANPKAYTAYSTVANTTTPTTKPATVSQIPDQTTTTTISVVNSDRAPYTETRYQDTIQNVTKLHTVTITQQNTQQKHQVAASPINKPARVGARSGSVRYSSVYSCVGAKPSTTTASVPTVTITVTQTVTAVVQTIYATVGTQTVLQTVATVPVTATYSTTIVSNVIANEDIIRPTATQTVEATETAVVVLKQRFRMQFTSSNQSSNLYAYTR
ncbi:hypothetical protein QQS21_003371 [Conoideocrella luteorostrata]|uniref:Uncharacterized protein n=1 Tax=Conoideocrella luteorostrata TaxID=1105319 RepID=A0AAJ0G0J8_9HYPO|nr:hypothetical protein QQS21_003371 [Conoideocrella luteorostrata]